MSDAGSQRVRRIVEQALDLDGEERRIFLDTACGDDARVRAEVERLLARVDSGDPDFLEPPTPPAAATDPKHVLGEFDLVSELGRGGMGVVYLARQERLRRDVAVKVLVEGPGTSESDVERFHREARASAGLRHPGIVQVFADGQTESTHWFAMEYVAGHDLQREIALQRQGAVLESDRPFLPRPNEPKHAARLAELCAAVADALQHAHEHGLVHRDIKPQNLLLQPDGRVQIGDFGLVRDESLGSITKTGDVAGTPHYMSPEQARVSAGKVDHRTDVYSLGVVMYELATLERPFDGKTSADVITKIRDTEPRGLRRVNASLPRDLETICLKAMAKDPRARYATAGAMRDDLNRFLAHEAILARPPSLPARSRRWLKRNRVPVGGLILTLAGLWVGASVTRHVAEAKGRGSLSVTARDAAGEPLPGRALLARIDEVSGVAGEAQPAGALPIERLGVEPGYYRVVVEVEGDGSRIFARRIEAGEPSRVEALVAPHQSREGMVLVEGGTLALRDERAPLVALNNRDVDVASFWLDATEVSNADYRRFLGDTGHPAPRHWAKIGPEHDDLPVCCVSWRDARAFAEWAGKHLPSYAEWNWAARGSEGRDFPWGSDELRGNVFHGEGPHDDEALFRWYAERIAPVRSMPEAATESRIHHLFGNVSEFTESMPSDRVDGEFVPMFDFRITAGHAWDAGTFAGVGHTLQTFGWYGIEATHASHRVGFRCAATIQPSN